MSGQGAATGFWTACGRQADAKPDAPALFFPDHQAEPTTFGMLAGQLAGIRRRLADAGCRPGDIFALDMDDQRLHALLLLACVQAGIATASGVRDASGLAMGVSLKATLTDRAGPVVADSWGGAPLHLRVDAGWIEADATDASGAVSHEPRADDLCRIMLTSGSTGTQKPVFLTYGMVQERLASYAHAFGPEFPSCPAFMCGMQLSTSLGYLFLLHAIARGAHFCADSTDFERLVGAIRTYDLRALVTTPFTLAEITKYVEASGAAFPRLSLVMTAGSLASPSLVERVRGALGDRLVIFYGTTETGVICSLGGEGETGNVGQPVRGRQVDIIGDDGRLLPQGEVGAIRVRADTGPLPFHGPGDWVTREAQLTYLPGDVGMLNGEGEAFVILGRADNVINAGGSKTTPEIIESQIGSAPGVQECGVVAKPDELGVARIVAVLVLAPDWDQSSFLEHCQAHVLPDFLPAKFVLAKALPRAANNKIDRRALAAMA